MATGINIVTVAFSVRNRLALAGPQHPIELTSSLRALWHHGLDEAEVRAAVDALIHRKLAVRCGRDRVAAAHKQVFQHRGYAGPVEMSEDDPRLWEGWH